MQRFKFLVFIFIVVLLSNYISGYAQSNNKLFNDGFTILAFGDWGRQGIKIQKEVAEQMGIFAEANDVKFLSVLGDNFYENGVTGTDDSHWKKSFEDVYTAKSLQVPWYVVLGNHDYRENPQAQIDYMQLSSRWKMPARYYSENIMINDSTEALFVYIDTSPFVESYYTRSSMKNVLTQNTGEQLKWIDSVLANSNAKYKIVSGHHPVYSYGEHGQTIELVQQLKPILEKYNVNLYLAGHEHDMQYLYDGGSVRYFVSGAGSETRSTESGPLTIFAKGKTAGFLLLNFTTGNIKAAFVDHKGNVLYQTEISN